MSYKDPFSHISVGCLLRNLGGVECIKGFVAKVGRETTMEVELWSVYNYDCLNHKLTVKLVAIEGFTCY